MDRSIGIAASLDTLLEVSLSVEQPNINRVRHRQIADLQERLAVARRALEFQPPVLNQAVLADFIAEGHYERHLRRMRAAYRERLDAMVSAAACFCGNALRVRPVLTGLHAVADLEEGDDERVAWEASARGHSR
jgi:GntR family transcriptional regulator / MocR family aminotransferase